MSKALGRRTVMSGSISRGKNDPSQSLQMMERPLMTPDELKAMPKGEFIIMKTGVHPTRTRLRLFLDWGIRFLTPYEVPERAQRPVAYADKQELEEAIIRSTIPDFFDEEFEEDAGSARKTGGALHPRAGGAAPRRSPQAGHPYLRGGRAMGYFDSIYAAGLPHRAVAGLHVPEKPG